MRLVNVLPVLILFFIMLFANSCGINEETLGKKKWQVTLSKEKKTPYGTYLAYQSLKYYFGEADIQDLSAQFRYVDMNTKMCKPYIGHNLMILSGLDFALSDDEWKSLKSYIAEGNELVIFGSFFDNIILNELDYKKIGSFEEYGLLFDHNKIIPENKDILYFNDSPNHKYGYYGRNIQGYFYPKNEKSKNEVLDEQETISKNETSDILQKERYSSKKNNDIFASQFIQENIIGFVAKRENLIISNKPNCLRFRLGKGHLTLHAAPLVLSNYFLLQPDNINYLTHLWQTLPDDITTVYWQDYFKRNSDVSDFSVLWRFKETKLALILTLIGGLIYLIFASKRRQRIIPEILPLKNSSVSFVETVGRLYYNKGDHANISIKLMQQFLEWVRTHYYLQTNFLNENFIKQLVAKSGLPLALVEEMVTMINEIKSGSVKVDEVYIYKLYQLIQQFYSTNKSYGK